MKKDKKFKKDQKIETSSKKGESFKETNKLIW